jgi:dihydrofolate reductase
LKTVTIFVSTLDGKVTKWENPDVKLWSSKEDQNYFKKLWEESKLLVMGSNTFNADPIKPSPGHLAIIMTRDPARYKKYEVPGLLEFTDNSPLQLIARYNNAGFNQMLIVGGPHLSTSFLKEQLIDELWLTIEPIIFGKGLNFALEEKLDINLRLISCEKVNERGTLITKYKILKE